MAHYIGGIPIHPIDDILKYLLPPVSPLVNTTLPGHPKISDYLELPTTSSDSGSEEMVFKNLPEYFRKLLDLHRPNSPTSPSRCTTLKDTPNRPPTGSDTKHRPDACLVLLHATCPVGVEAEADAGTDRQPGEMSWVDVAVVFEYKRNRNIKNWQDVRPTKL